MSMVGRLYTWRTRTWRVLERWRNAPGSFGVVAPAATFVCRDCGTINPPADPGLTCGLCGGWRQVRRGAPRNVLIEDVETGERIVRPFRGLRRAEQAAETLNALKIGGKR